MKTLASPLVRNFKNPHLNTFHGRFSQFLVNWILKIYKNIHHVPSILMPKYLNHETRIFTIYTWCYPYNYNFLIKIYKQTKKTYIYPTFLTKNPINLVSDKHKYQTNTISIPNVHNFICTQKSHCFCF